MYRLFFSFLFVFSFINFSSLSPIYSLFEEEESIQIGRLSPEALAHYTPLILEELNLGTAFQNDLRTQRKTRELGYSFFKMMEGDFTYSSPPQHLNELGQEVCRALGHPKVEFTNFILSFYDPGYHLEPHFDMDESGLDKYGFCWGEEVFGLIIEPDPTGHLYYVKYEGKESVPPLNLDPIYSLKEEPGTVFLMRGKFRHAPYNHGVQQVSKRRISVTFRTTQINKP